MEAGQQHVLPLVNEFNREAQGLVANIEIRPASIIVQFRDLLRDRYKRDGGEFPLLKEIVQNADDARANELRLIVVDGGVAGIRNPLLNGPALVCINDGRFTTENESAIRSFGLTSKAQDHGAIGRFGVGQKSVFHLAEAFFFLGRASVDDPVRGDVIDPWATSKGDPDRPDWNDFSGEDRSQMLALVGRWVTGPSWFLLYLPLRIAAHGRRPTGGLITPHFPDVDHLARQLEDLTEFGCLMPQLHHLRRIESWRTGGHGTEPRALGTAAWKVGAARLSRPVSDAPFARAFGGEVEVAKPGGGIERFTAFGHERCIQEPALQEMPRHPKWPQRATEDQLGATIDVPEKAIPHGAATIVRTGGESSELQLGWAVFLPLSIERETIAAATPGTGWRIWLHGYFFPDSGRRAFTASESAKDLAGVEDAPEEIHEAWNARLRDMATLPSLLEAVAGCVDVIDTAEGEGLGHALASTALWKKHRSAATVSAALAWGPWRRENGAIETRHRRISPTLRLLPLPRPSSGDLAQLADLFLAWLRPEKVGSAAVVWADGPRLGQRPQWDSWERRDVEAVLGSLDPEVLTKNSVALEVLAQCLQKVRDSCIDLGSPLLGFLRRCFRASVLTVGANNEHWRSLAELCPPTTILWSGANVTLLRELAKVEPPTSVLLLPADLRPAGVDGSRVALSLVDARRILSILAGKVQAESGADAVRLVADVVSSIGAAAVLEDVELRSLPLFRVWSARLGRHVCMQAATLHALKERGAAFRKKGLGGPEELCRKFARAIESASLDDLVLVDDDGIAEAMSIGPFDENTVTILLRHPATVLAGEQARHELLLALLGAGSGSFGIRDLEKSAARNAALRLALRLVIHGDGAHRDDDAPLLLLPHGEEDAAGLQFAAEVLRATGSSWCVVPQRMGHDLNQRWMQSLGVKSLTTDTLIERMNGTQGPWRAAIGDALSAPARAALRRMLAEKHSDDLFKSLTIHDTVSGAVVSVGTPHVYLIGQWAVPVCFSDRIHLVAPSEEQVVHNAQLRNIRPWSPAEQIEVSLRGTDLASRTTEILDAIFALTTIPDDLRSTLRATAWLPTSDGHWASPNDLLNIPEGIDVVLRLLIGSGDRVFWAASEIRSDASDHAAFTKVLKHLALSEHEAIAAAALQLDERIVVGANRFWVLASRSRDSDQAFLERGIGLATLGSDPTWNLVGALSRSYGQRWFEIAAGLMAVLRQGPDAKRIVQLLLRFKDEKNLAEGDVEPSRALFDDYLRYARGRPDFSTVILPQIHLLNARGTWKSTAQLACSDGNLQPQFQLIERHRLVVGSAADVVERTAIPGYSGDRRVRPGPDDLATAGRILEEYFASLTGRVSAEAIGYFLACLGDGEGNSVADLAQRYLQVSKTVEGAREMVFFGLPAENVGPEKQFAERARWAVEIVSDGGEVDITSLAGTSFRACVAGASLSGFFVGEVPPSSEKGRWLRFRRVDPGAHNANELHEALGASLASFVSASVGVQLDRAKLAQFWSGLGRGGQSQVEAVRSLILEQLPFYIDILLVRRDDLFRDVCQRLDRAEQRLREVEGNAGLWEGRQTSVQAERKRARDALRELVENNEDAQARLLHAVRAKLATYQYSPEQTLFELFQNADDAATELIDAGGSGKQGAHTDVGTFRVEVRRATGFMRVQHWGRPINRALMGGTLSQGRSRGQEFDLKNMLGLHLSEKTETSTGRFGLGFKSIHLLTSRPRVKSSDLSFEILGGLLPRHRPLAEVPDASTVIEFELDAPQLLDRALAHFEVSGGLLPVFAQTIRRVSFNDQVLLESSWTPTQVGGVEELEVGDVTRFDGDGAAAPMRLLVLRGRGGGPHVAVAFRLGVRGVEGFATPIPDLWCTAPTLEQWGMGFCMNAPFAVDVGRGQLARAAPDNERLFGELGQLLARGLGALCRALEERFEATAEVLRIETGGRKAEEIRRRFWTSMFERLTGFSAAEQISDRATLLRAVHAEGRGLSGLIAGSRVLPTALPGAHDVLTTLGVVSWVVDDLAARPEVFRRLCDLGWLGATVVPGTAVASAVAIRLQKIGVRIGEKAIPLDLKGILERSISTGVIMSPVLARSCWELLRALETIADAQALARVSQLEVAGQGA